MPELHSNGNYEAYLAQLFNPLAGGTQFNPSAGGASFNPGPFGGMGAGANPYMAAQQQNPWTTQFMQSQLPAQSLQAVQAALQIVARQAAHAVQCAQALQQLAQHIGAQPMGAQPWTQQSTGWQPQFGQGIGGGFGASQIGQGLGQFYGWAPQNAAMQQQALQQLQQIAQYLASQQPQQFRYGLAA